MRRGVTRCVGLLLAASLLLGAHSAGAKGADPAAAPHAGHGEAAAHAHGAGQGQAHDDHAHDDHGGGHGEHVPHWSEINWFYGMIGEKEGVTPNLLWRPVGMPVPLGAMLLNTALLFFLLGRFFGPATKTGLLNRKKRIAGEIEAAAKMKAEAEDQLAYYEGQLAEMEKEMERIKKEMREQAEVERKNILEEARLHREAMEREAKKSIEQELAQARYDAMNAAVAYAVELAEQKIRSSMGPQDDERLATQMLGAIEGHFKKTELSS